MANAETTAPAQDASVLPDAGWRNQIAKYVVVFSFIVLGALVLFAGAGALWVVFFPGSASQFQTGSAFIKELIGLILPVLGTWVGTVLAFYFARENFEAASKALAAGGQSAIETIKVVDVMLPRDRIRNAVMFKDGVTEESVTVAQLQEALKDRGVSRILFLEADGAVRYVLHDSVVFRDIVRNGPGPAGARSLKDLLDADTDGAGTARARARAFKFVSEAGTLGDCQRRMQDGQCRDVFVTKSGGHNEPPIGWITDLDVRRHARP